MPLGRVGGDFSQPMQGTSQQTLDQIGMLGLGRGLPDLGGFGGAPSALPWAGGGGGGMPNLFPQSMQLNDPTAAFKAAWTPYMDQIGQAAQPAPVQAPAVAPQPTPDLGVFTPAPQLTGAQVLGQQPPATPMQPAPTAPRAVPKPAPVVKPAPVYNSTSKLSPETIAAARYHGKDPLLPQYAWNIREHGR